ncbi:hypothetical protein HY640_02735 [Candidatus Woesearchaeota archaeon]|nr:hypothetical protein [Candidatus Woesearchaeota archaeon]
MQDVNMIEEARQLFTDGQLESIITNVYVAMNGTQPDEKSSMQIAAGVRAVATAFTLAPKLTYSCAVMSAKVMLDDYKAGQLKEHSGDESKLPEIIWLADAFLAYLANNVEYLRPRKTSPEGND